MGLMSERRYADGNGAPERTYISQEELDIWDADLERDVSQMRIQQIEELRQAIAQASNNASMLSECFIRQVGMERIMEFCIQLINNDKCLSEYFDEQTMNK